MQALFAVLRVPSRRVTLAPCAPLQIKPRPSPAERPSPSNPKPRVLDPSISDSAMLTDTFNRKHTYLRISLTEKCNLRCQYCMPAEGIELTPREEILTAEEVLRIARLFVAHGVNKIRLTGGEPTVRPDILEIVQELGRIPGLTTIGMTSNGIGVPRKLPALVDAGLNRLNLSLDTLQEHKFTLITRRKGFKQVMRTIELALELGITPLKLNCVVMRGSNEEELADFVDLVKDKPIDVRFIEFMPFGGNKWKKNVFVPYTEMIEMIETRHPKLVPVETEPNDTARSYRCDGYKGTVSFITSMSKAFCSSCNSSQLNSNSNSQWSGNRLRVTADGNLKVYLSPQQQQLISRQVCLFGNTEQNLRDCIRDGFSDDQLAEVVQAAVLRKKAAHAGMDNLVNMENRPMILIGG